MLISFCCSIGVSEQDVEYARFEFVLSFPPFNRRLVDIFRIFFSTFKTKISFLKKTCAVKSAKSNHLSMCHVKIHL